MTDVFNLRPPALPIAGDARLFPVRRVWCVGRNYAAHAAEMGGEPSREPPFFFAKAADMLDPSGQFPYPPMTEEVHHEVELAVALGSGGADIPVAAARDCVWGHAVAIDMTRRDLQAQAKKGGRPWEMAKAFDRSAPIGPLFRAAAHPERGAITLHLNGALRQSGDLADMIWSVPEIIAELSRFVTLAAGDVILTGTPAGVGPVRRGDVMEARIEGVGALSVTVI